MPIDTPKQALLPDELPSASAHEAGIKSIVLTNTGMKTLDLAVLFEPYSLLIGAYQFYASGYPTSFAIPMMGGLLDPADFEDNLRVLKQRVPNDWINNDGKVQLPLVMDHVLQQDLSLQMGQMQQDAMQNIKGNFGGSNEGAFSGPFAHNYNGGQLELKGVRPGGSPANVTFDLSRAARTANKTRENTLNGLLCIITGKNHAIATKQYYIIHPDHGAYVGWTITLPVGKNGQGIGFNPAVMSEQEPAEFSQAALADIWAKTQPSDPLGLAMRVKTRNVWDFSHFENIYKTFRIAGKDIFITANIDGVKMMGGDGTQSIVFTGKPIFNSTAAWGSSYGVQYNCTSVIINGQGFNLFTITGLPQVAIHYRVKGGNAILSMVSDGKELDQTWWANLSSRCPADRLQDLQAWLQNMPNGMYNAANTQDTLDNVPASRFYLHSSDYTPKRPPQVDIWTAFQAATVTDGLGIYAAALLSNFRLSDFVPKENRTFWIEGFQVEIDADATGIKFTTQDRYYLRVEGAISVGNQTNLYGQTKQVIYHIVPPGYYAGTPNGQEVAFKNGWTFRALIAVKEKNVLLTFPGQGNDDLYLNFDKVKELMGLAPAGQEALAREIFDHLPKDWDNTTNRDTMGKNHSIAQARFWMKGKEVI